MRWNYFDILLYIWLLHLWPSSNYFIKRCQSPTYSKICSCYSFWQFYFCKLTGRPRQSIFYFVQRAIRPLICCQMIKLRVNWSRQVPKMTCKRYLAGAVRAQIQEFQIMSLADEFLISTVILSELELLCLYHKYFQRRCFRRLCVFIVFKWVYFHHRSNQIK